MRAVSYSLAGSAEEVLEIRDLPVPEPGPGEVRVKVHFSAVNPTDVKRRSAEVPLFGDFQVPHHDGSGVIDGVGQDVSQERLGQRVWIYHGADRRSHGTAAEYICISQDQAVPLPADVDLVTGATIGIPMMTAAHALHLGGDIAGKHVLITGGAGAVGSAAISLAHRAGAQVTATVSSASKAAVAREAGADFVLNYRANDIGQELKALSRGIDLVIDVAIGNNLDSYLPYLQNHARIISYASDAPELVTAIRPLMFANIRIEFFVIFLIGKVDIERAVAAVSDALAQNVRPILPVSKFAPENSGDAHRFVEDHNLGRAVITFTN